MVSRDLLALAEHWQIQEENRGLDPLPYPSDMVIFNYLFEIKILVLTGSGSGFLIFNSQDPVDNSIFY